MDRRTLITLGAVALLLGAVTPMMAAADEYDEIGTAEEGVYAVTAEEERLRVAASEPADVVVATPAGEVVDARSLDAEETHTVVLDQPEALVAVQEGSVEIQTKGGGNVDAADTTTETVQLVETEDSALDRSLTVQVPDGTLLAQAGLDGEADGLELEIASEDDPLLRATQAELAQPEALAPQVAEADAVDVSVDAANLNGSIEMTVTRALDAAAEPTSREAQSSPSQEDKQGFNASVDVSEVEHTPIAFTVPEGEPARLVANLTAGHIFDASVYDANGSQVHHLHAGVALDEHRQQCEFYECWHGWQDYEEFAPQTLERELAPGDYVLFVREAEADGTLAIQHPEGSVLDRASERDWTDIRVADDRTLQTDRPVLDVWRSVNHDDARIQQTVTVDVGNETAYELSALAKSFGYALEPELELAPGEFGAGEIAVTVDSARDDTMTNGHVATVYVLGE